MMCMYIYIPYWLFPIGFVAGDAAFAAGAAATSAGAAA